MNEWKTARDMRGTLLRRCKRRVWGGVPLRVWELLNIRSPCTAVQYIHAALQHNAALQHRNKSIGKVCPSPVLIAALQHDISSPSLAALRHWLRKKLLHCSIKFNLFWTSYPFPYHPRCIATCLVKWLQLFNLTLYRCWCWLESCWFSVDSCRDFALDRLLVSSAALIYFGFSLPVFWRV